MVDSVSFFLVGRPILVDLNSGQILIIAWQALVTFRLIASSGAYASVIVWVYFRTFMFVGSDNVHINLVAWHFICFTP